MSPVKNICIAGKNRIAIDAINTAHRKHSSATLWAVCNDNDDGTDMWQPSFRKFCIESGIPVIDLERVQKMENLLFLSTEFDKIIKIERFLKNSVLVNIHFSDLPAYKGMYTSCLPILHGARSSGCTLHEIDDGIDTGPIIARSRFPLSPNETAKTLYAKYIEKGSALIDNTFPDIITRTYTPKVQGYSGSTYFSKQAVDYANLTVNLKATAEQLSRQIRAFNHRSYQLPIVFGYPISRCITLAERSVAKPGAMISQTAAETRVASIDYDCLLVHDRFEDAEMAVTRDDGATLRLLLARDPTLAMETNARGWSLLARAAYNGCLGAISALLDHAADPDITNGKGTTPLMYAKDRLLMANDPSPTTMLLAAGANPQRRDYRGKTVFDYMSDAECERFKAVLLPPNRP